jgi:hypothetical protein
MVNLEPKLGLKEGEGGYIVGLIDELDQEAAKALMYFWGGRRRRARACQGRGTSHHFSTKEIGSF